MSRRGVELLPERGGPAQHRPRSPTMGEQCEKSRIDRSEINRENRGGTTCETTKPVEWFLLTSVRVECIEAALDTIEHYLRRWRMEDFFRVLKSGCRAEHLGFHSAERLQRALTIQAVIAWRLMLMTLLGREVPECDTELLFTAHSGEADHRFRCQADHPVRSSRSPVGAKRRGGSIMPFSDRLGSMASSSFASILP